MNSLLKVASFFLGLLLVACNREPFKCEVTLECIKCNYPIESAIFQKLYVLSFDDLGLPDNWNVVSGTALSKKDENSNGNKTVYLYKENPEYEWINNGFVPLCPIKMELGTWYLLGFSAPRKTVFIHVHENGTYTSYYPPTITNF